MSNAAAIDDLLARLGAGTPEEPVPLGRYDVVGRLGRGGMGTVYEAIDRDRGTRVAVKTLKVADAKGAVALKREFRVVADLAHPHLAPVYELGCEEGVWFFTMERVLGSSLVTWARGEGEHGVPSSQLPLSRTLETIDERGDATIRDVDHALPVPLANEDSTACLPIRSTEDVRRVLHELALAVAALHGAGLRHGDIKPTNVLVRDDGSVALVDFGLARPVHESKRKKGAGTPMYMAPEQMTGDYVGLESDWYSVGVTTYRLLTGWLPFVAGSMIDLYLKKTNHVPVPPHELLPEVPADLSELCLALLRPEVGERPNERTVLRVLGGEEVPAPPSDRQRRAPFVGRDEELVALERAYGTARAGQLTVVQTRGPSGIGKSALLRSFLRGVHEVDSAVVLRGRCYERESVPYKAFDRIVDELSEHLRTLADEDVEPLLPVYIGELAQVFPALALVPEVARRVGEPVAVDARELRRRAWRGLEELLTALRRVRPVVVAIDDLQWADADSAGLLAALLDGGAAALMIIISYRSAEARENPTITPYFEQAERLAARGRLVDLELAPLGPQDADLLARACLRHVGVAVRPERVALFAEEARGVPFFIEELAHYIANHGDEDVGQGLSLDDAILARVKALPEVQRDLLEVVAVAHRPLPQSIVYEAAAVEAESLVALLALRRASLVSWLGAGADDTVWAYHDRIREAVLDDLDEDARFVRHLALGRALARRCLSEGPRTWVFEAVRHLGLAEPLIGDVDERREAAELHLAAGRIAREAAAFPLARACFEGGIDFLPDDAWDAHYDMALGLHVGAAEAAYLSAELSTLERRIAEVKAHGRTVMDQIVGWEVEIDAFVGRHDYDAAVRTAVEVLGLLGVEVPADPGEAEVGASVQETLARLTAIGTDGFVALPDLQDPAAAAATRIIVRASPAAYFGRPMLLPIFACKLVQTSIDEGLSIATPYALALFGIVLNTLELFPVSHLWGQLALGLLDRWSDRRLEAATRHVLHNLVCCWMVPLATILDPLREVFEIGCRTGDFEYASYAAHGYTHNALYAGRPLAPLLEETTALSARMEALGQVNALHVHHPFEQLLKGLVGDLEEPWNLSGDGFDEDGMLRRAEEDGSQAGLFVLHTVIGIARTTFGRHREAVLHLEAAKRLRAAGPSVWHQPILDQTLALAACALLPDDATDQADRAHLRELAEEALARLRRFAAFSEVNFGHRVAMVEAELLRIDGDAEGASSRYDEAIALARSGAWVNDIALINELAGRCAPPDRALPHMRAARAGYAAWGAQAKADQLAARIAETPRS